MKFCIKLWAGSAGWILPSFYFFMQIFPSFLILHKFDTFTVIQYTVKVLILKNKKLCPGKLSIIT